VGTQSQGSCHFFKIAQPPKEKTMKNILLLAFPFATLACTTTPNSKEPIEDRQDNRGRISIPLTSTSSSGTIYYLHLPTVLIEGSEETLDLSFEHNEVFDVSLQEGEYSLTVRDWTLYRAMGDELEEVEAEITSENPQMITIEGGQTTHSVIRFRTLAEDLSFEYGNLEMDFEVEEGNDQIDDENSYEAVVCGTESYHGDITFTNQEQFNQFVEQYDTVVGGVSLEGNDIEDASGLACLQTNSLVIQDTLITQLDVAAQDALHILQIQDNSILQMSYLPVEEIGHLTIRGNHELTDIETNHSQSYNIFVEDNASLERLVMPLLLENYSDVQIRDNPSLQTVEANQLLSVGNRIKVEDNASLQEFSLPLLELTGGGIEIQNNAMLQRLSFPDLVVVGELSHSGSINASLRINNNESLSTTSFPSLFYIARHLYISNNDQLDSMDGFDTLVSVDDLFIIGNARMNDVLELTTLTEVDRINISYNPHLPEAMVNFLVDVEIGINAVQHSVHIENNSAVSMVDYASAACSAQYIAVHAGDFYPLGSQVTMSSAATECNQTEFYEDGTVWEISSDCICIE